MYLIDDEIDTDATFNKNTKNVIPSIYSDEVESAVNELDSRMIVNINVKRTIGGDERFDYYLTENGVEKAERLISNTDEERKIRQIYDEYGDVPVTNLLSDIKESEPAHSWS